MSSNVASRKLIRAHILSLLSALIGEGKPTAYIYNGKPKKFIHGTPAVCIASAGSNRTKQATPAATANSLKFDLHIFVRYADADATPAWTESESEDALDDIEAQITDIIIDNAESLENAYIKLDGDTEVDAVIISGKQYQHEAVPILIQLFSN